ncbi:MAG TPA: HEAT repeat domain-containing protein [Thermoanaerobaculia bacterium]|nr:HEAT repeat domain-containing protein [Thermoanaerobaculia bacterium]
MSSPEDAVRIGDVARVLAMAWKNIAAYPPGHPIFVSSLDEAHRKIVGQATLAGALTLGIGRNALLSGEERVDSPHAQKFAEALYRRGVALLTIEQEVEPWELEMLFRFISGEVRAGSKPLWDELTEAGVTHLELVPVDYSGVRTTEGFDEPRREEKDETLFEDILRALLTGREISAEGVELREGEAIEAEGLASLLMRFLGELPGERGAGAGVEGSGGGGGGAAGVHSGRAGEVADLIAEKLTTHLRRPGAARRQVTIHQIAELLRNLPRDVRERVLESAVKVLAGDASAAQELRSLAGSLGPDEVFRALSKVRSAGGTLSAHALELLQQLMVTTGADSREIPDAALPEVAALTDEISHLLGGDDIDRYNPPEHRELLEQVRLEIPAAEEGARERALELGPERLGTIEEDAVNRAVRLALLEMIRRQDPSADLAPIFARLETQFLELLGTMQMAEAIELADTIQGFARKPGVPAHIQAAGRRSVERLATGEAIKVLVDWLHLAADDLIPQIQRIIDLFGSIGTRNFLYALVEEQDRSRRRRIFDFLVGLGPLVVPDAIALLGDARWYVVRNMIVLLRTVGDKRSVPEIRKLAAHPDIRVRLEAIKSLLASDNRLPRDLLEKAISDPDPKLAETAVTLCGSYGIAEAEEPLVRIVLARDWFGRHQALRMKALKALSELARPSTLDHLAPLLRERRFARVNHEARRYAYELLEFYPAAARAPWVDEGLRSRDASVREAAERLAARKDRPLPEGSA